MRHTLAVILVLGAVSGTCYWAYLRTAETFQSPDDLADNTSPGPDLVAARPPRDPRVPVANNRGPDVLDGYRGEVHPALRRQAPLEVRAFWEHPRSNYLGADSPPEVETLYHAATVAAPVRAYAARDFSAFMPPDNAHTAGQLWELDRDRVAVFLKQFHPAVSTRSASAGRRPGPDGAFAVLRGVSPSRLDIAFRIHAEFDLASGGNDRLLAAWYSPASFTGRMIVDRAAGAVTCFRLGVPADRQTNMHATCWTRFGLRVHQTHRVERMELVGGGPEDVEGVPWASRIEPEQADDRLARVFYKFREINFVRPDRALAAAQEQKKPILAVVLLGALDDQSC